jgi:Fe-S cluster assembly iron-binding protein IscA
VDLLERVSRKELKVLEITDTAAEAIKGMVSSRGADNGGVRIIARPESLPERALEVSVAVIPAEDDEVVEEAGAQVFLEPRAAEFLEDKVLDAEVDKLGQVTFGVREQD